MNTIAKIINAPIKLAKKILADPKGRLAGRALVVGAVVLGKCLWNADAVDATVLQAALAAAGMAAIEVFTPLNALVGYLKPTLPAK